MARQKDTGHTNHIPEPKLPLTEILKTIPEFFGVRLNEEPNYQVLEKDGQVEVRRYGPRLLARVTVPGATYDGYKEEAFKRLANYIFGGNSHDEKLAMTSPVLQESGKDADAEQMAMTAPVLQEQGSTGDWTMTFILPAKYRLANAPKPLDLGIKLEELAPQTIVALRYGGTNTLEKMREHERELRDWLAKRPDLHAEGAFISAQYDAPFVLPFFKRNEIQVCARRGH